MQGEILEKERFNVRDKQGKIRKKMKVYSVRYRYTDPMTGKRKRTTKHGFLTKGDAEAFLLEINNQQNQNMYFTPKTILVKDFLNDWLKSYVEVNVRATTYLGYKRIIEKHLIPNLGGLDLKKLSSLDIDRLYAYLLKDGRADGKGGLSQTVERCVHRVFNEALSYAVKKKLIYVNPMTSISNVPKPKKYRGNIYTAEEILHLLEIVKDTVYEVPVALASICGLREGECLAIKEDDVDFDHMTININKQLTLLAKEVVVTPPKSEESNRLISAPKEVFDIIRCRIEKNHQHKKLLEDEYDDQGWIVCQDNGKLINPQYFSKNFANMIARKKLKKIRFHDLRHSCASLMLTSGVAMKTASQILGHSSISITADLYTHVTQDNKRIAAKQVANTLFGKSNPKSEKNQ